MVFVFFLNGIVVGSVVGAVLMAIVASGKQADRQVKSPTLSHDVTRMGRA